MDDATQTEETSGPGTTPSPESEVPNATGRMRRRVAACVLCLFALAGFAITAVGLDTSIWLPDLFAARNAATMANCQNNLKQMGLVYKMYANESQGEVYPPLTGESGNLLFSWQEVYPQPLTNRDVLVCPGPAGEPPENTFTDQYYVYTGYLLTNQEDLEAFAGAYTAEIAAGGDFFQDLPVESSYADEIFRLREGIERFMITDINSPAGSAHAQSNIPLMWEWPDNHDTGHGANVLFMDGHVEWVPFGERFPITEEALAVFAGLADYTAPTEWSASYNEPQYTMPPAPVSGCQNHMKIQGLTVTMYSNEVAGEYLPPLGNEPGRLIMDPGAVYPEYVNDPGIFLCPGRAPSDPPLNFDDGHYVYLGYMMMDDNDVQQFATTYNQVIAAGGDFTGDLDVASSYGPSLLRLRQGVETALVTEITEPTQDVIGRHHIPVMLEWPENHENNLGGNVLFMDGHTEWMPYPGEFPMTEVTIATLRALAENTPASSWALPDSRPDPHGYLRNCNGNMRQWGLVGKMFSNADQDNLWPPLSLTPGELAMRDVDIFPEYTHSWHIGVCPGTDVNDDIDHFDDRHYAYLGYVLLTDGDALQFAAAYDAEIAAGGNFSGDLLATTSYGDAFVRMREGIERFVLDGEDDPTYPNVSQSRIPVMLEWPGNHEGLTGGHVLYMDGHTEWHEYPGEFPMTEATIAALDSIADWTPTTAWAVPRFPSFDTYNHLVCKTNEHAFGLAFKIHANVADNATFPPLSRESNRLVPEGERFQRYYLRDARHYNCPGSPNAYRQPTVDDHSYAYLGYVVRDLAELSRFADAYEQQLAAGGNFEENLLEGENTLYRIKEGIERFLSSDPDNPPAVFAQRDIPVLIEWPDNHGDIRGGNVLYMDGHAEWLDYPGEYPMTEEAMAVLTELAGRGPIRPPLPPRERSRLDALILQNAAD